MEEQWVVNGVDRLHAHYHLHVSATRQQSGGKVVVTTTNTQRCNDHMIILSNVNIYRLEISPNCTHYARASIWIKCKTTSLSFTLRDLHSRNCFWPRADNFTSTWFSQYNIVVVFDYALSSFGKHSPMQTYLYTHALALIFVHTSSFLKQATA